jgi:hypothetical protein
MCSTFFAHTSTWSEPSEHRNGTSHIGAVVLRPAYRLLSHGAVATGRTWSVRVRQRRRELHITLGEHPKPAIDGHLKTGHHA